MDRRSLLAASGHAIFFLDSLTGEQQSAALEFPEFGPSLSHVRFNREAEKLVVIGFNGGVQVRNAATGENIPLSLKRQDGVYEADLSPNGQWVAVGDWHGSSLRRKRRKLDHLAVASQRVGVREWGFTRTDAC